MSQVLPSLLLGETVFLNDLPPEEAQARLAAQSLDLSYAKFLGQRALPLDQATTYSAAEGRIATNPEDYLQSSYQASQFHGQDGLGRAMFGYSDWNQGRLEARNANGEVRGSYQYVDAFGENVIVSIFILMLYYLIVIFKSNVRLTGQLLGRPSRLPPNRQPALRPVRPRSRH